MIKGEKAVIQSVQSSNTAEKAPDQESGDLSLLRLLP